MSDTEGLWVEVEGFEGVENYFVDETFELPWKSVTHTYAVLIRECDYSAYAEGTEGILPDLLRYSTDSCSLEDIEDDDEKAFVVDTINKFYEADVESSS